MFKNIFENSLKKIKKVIGKICKKSLENHKAMSNRSKVTKKAFKPENIVQKSFCPKLKKNHRQKYFLKTYLYET